MEIQGQAIAQGKHPDLVRAERRVKEDRAAGEEALDTEELVSAISKRQQTLAELQLTDAECLYAQKDETGLIQALMFWSGEPSLPPPCRVACLQAVGIIMAKEAEIEGLDQGGMNMAKQMGRLVTVLEGLIDRFAPTRGKVKPWDKARDAVDSLKGVAP